MKAIGLEKLVISKWRERYVVFGEGVAMATYLLQ